ncbi:toxin-antitoxin system YwqK family antitoxin [uncultured Alistipes sp.]|uniref:toxin-antitoxin system YwqK family antitoxin n=1 Tax=uncultured Alistipes sp. TaxID=538949 RepID=UPI0025FBED10|nr:hypothetical protein [uncultured Alistipes sp.]
MKKSILLILEICATLPVIGQATIDTLYYDKNWKREENKIFASYYRIVCSSDESRQYRDYYITGELQSEGHYITIDPNDDSRSVFDGKWTTYYKSGQIALQGTRIDGKREGPYTEYEENGLVRRRAYFRNDLLHGVCSDFTADGRQCKQIEYEHGKPRYNYYVISNQAGHCNKVRFSDRRPIYESPSLYEKKTRYKHGEAWPYYNKNGILVNTTNRVIRDYGKYFRINITIANHSMFPIEFNPERIVAASTDKKGIGHVLKVYAADEYLRKVKRRQNWAIAFTAFAEGMSAANAGYSTSTTYTSYNGYTYGTFGTSSYCGHSNTTNLTYNGAAAYQAQIIANNRIATYEQSLLTERAAKNQGYLRKTTIYPGEVITGYINIEYQKGISMTVNIDINGAIYTFPWDTAN